MLGLEFGSTRKSSVNSVVNTAPPNPPWLSHAPKFCDKITKSVISTIPLESISATSPVPLPKCVTTKTRSKISILELLTKTGQSIA